MQSELQAAVGFLCSLLYNKLPRRKVTLFGEQLLANLTHKFSAHWYPHEPAKGRNFRCVRVSATGLTDAMVSVAAEAIGLTLDDILQHINFDLCIFVDPGEVSYQVGDSGAPTVIYRAVEPVPLGPLGGSCWAMTPEPSHTPLNPPLLQSSLSVPSDPGQEKFTVGTFAMTRFGTTKLKTSAFQAMRYLPVHFQQHQNGGSSVSPSSTPLSLSPMSETSSGGWPTGLVPFSDRSDSPSSSFNPLSYDSIWSDGGMSSKNPTPDFSDAFQISRIWS